MTIHTYETTYEAEGDERTVIASVELQIDYTYSPASGDHYDPSVGGPGGWTPGDAEQFEIIEIREEFKVAGWMKVDGIMLESYREWAEREHGEAMIEAACYDEDAGAERAEARDRDDFEECS